MVQLTILSRYVAKVFSISLTVYITDLGDEGRGVSGYLDGTQRGGVVSPFQ